jgi:multiple sugar transport system ATP-binding protein
VMRKGELQQVAEPQELYDRPVNLFVGGFIGSPAMNMVEAEIARDNGGFTARIGDRSIPLSVELRAARPALEEHEGTTVIVGIRPEHLEDAALVPDAPPEQRLQGTVNLREALGSEVMVHFTVEAKPALTEDVRELAQDLDTAIARELDDSASHTTMVGRFGARSKLREGEVAEVALDASSLHFFDPETGLGIHDHLPKGAPA